MFGGAVRFRCFTSGRKRPPNGGGVPFSSDDTEKGEVVPEVQLLIVTIYFFVVFFCTRSRKIESLSLQAQDLSPRSGCR